MKILVTGSCGLIGSNVSRYFLNKNCKVYGIDNNTRQKLFGPEANINSNFDELIKFKNYIPFSVDIRDKKKMEFIFRENKFDLIVHCAAQPSHDKAKDIPLLDFEINALGTLNLLELTREFQNKAIFVYTSTNKVYGDNPNKLKIVEKETRYWYKDNIKGINETMSIDNNIHSLMGASKLSADLYVQEYGKNFGLKTTVLRLGCVTGSAHTGVKLHGFLSYLVKSIIHHGKYEIIGYKGKQVRDQIDATDVASAIYEIYKKPNYGEVYNLGGGIKNCSSILELISSIEKQTGLKTKISYSKKPRLGDHICYVTDYAKFKKRYPNWKIKKNIKEIVSEMVNYEKNHLG